MHAKIVQYVNYQFRFDQRENINEIKDEIISNLIDRYDDLRSKGLSEEEAYIEAIKRMGNATQTEETKVNEEYLNKPTWANVAMIVVSSLAVVGLIVSIISSFTGLLITFASITLFSASSYYLYSISQYNRAQNLDIDTQKINLRIIMKYFNTNYIFWTISISISFAALLVSGLFVVTAQSIAEILLDGGLGAVIIRYVFLWVIIFVILLFIFKEIKKRAFQHYIDITGEQVPKSEFHKAKPFLGHSKKDPMKNHIFIALYVLVTTIIIWYFNVEVIYNYGNQITTFSGPLLFSFERFRMAIILSIITLILYGFKVAKKKIPNWVLSPLTILSYLGYAGLYLLFLTVPSEVDVVTNAWIASLIFLVVYVGYLIYQTIHRNKTEKKRK